ncbi:MAG: hypothetical protein A3A73_04535 [Omnitrophica bacterium RIFCSPLOWO2_01_FULL_50_24]|nr:MAG: hypothetical protein A3A73_04535 [Omnitrophica bacterium RIFCSPLOWO2_01_FULL_50_24]
MNSEFERLLGELNREQMKAVTSPVGALLVLAGAGSGKTRILTLRAAHLIANGIPSIHLLGVTFTNKAANEMKRRVSRLVDHEVWISTFHSTCLKILRVDAFSAGLGTHFSIYDDHDQLVLIKECLHELGLDAYRQINPKGIREAIQRAKDYLVTPQRYRERAEDAFEKKVADVYERYEQRMGVLNACDFGDLILKTVFLFDRHPEVLEAWQKRFQHILIDEYQDTNHAQYRLVRHLTNQSQNITVVGDPDQSIYAWRGADIQNILNFEKDYPQARVVKLEQNYRSTSTILNAANALIACNVKRKPKELWTEAGRGERISIYEAADEKEEAEFIVREVLRVKQSRGSLADCVVFYRLHAQSRVLEEVLRARKIPYRIVGGIRFYDRKEIKDLIAYLKALAYPQDQLSFKRVVNLPNRGIGTKTISAFEAYQKSRGVTWNEALKNVSDLQGIGPRAKESLAQFGRMMESLKREKASFLASELLQEVVERTGYVKALESERTFESKVRIENIQEFFSAVQEFEENWEPAVEERAPKKGVQYRTDRSVPLLQAANRRSIEQYRTDRSAKRYEGLLEAFLESISLITDLDTWDEGSDSVTLMTLHTAKGLEFPVVFMVGMEEEVFPHVNSLRSDTGELEEERRLCYVGMTRAKEKLVLTYANSHRLYGIRQHHLPSRFLSEIPSSLFEEVSSFANSSREADETVVLDLDESKRRILFD